MGVATGGCEGCIPPGSKFWGDVPPPKITIFKENFLNMWQGFQITQHQSGVQCQLTASTGLRVDRVAIATKCQQILYDDIHRRLPVSLASENHEREPKRQECSQPSSIMLCEKNVRKKKLANVNTLLFRATARDVIPTRARGMTSVYA